MSIPTLDLVLPSTIPLHQSSPHAFVHVLAYKTAREACIFQNLQKEEPILRLNQGLNRVARIRLPKWSRVSLFVKILPNSNMFLVLFPLEAEGIERRAVHEQICEESRQWSFLGLIKMWELKLLPVSSGPALRWLGVQGRISGVWNWSVGPADMTLYKKDVFQCDIVLYLAGKLKNGYVYIMKWVKQMLNG